MQVIFNFLSLIINITTYNKLLIGIYKYIFIYLKFYQLSSVSI